MANNRITFEIGYTVDKTGLNDIQKSLRELQQAAENVDIGDELYEELQKAGNEAEKLSTVFNRSWNSQLQQLDLTRFNEELNKGHMTMASLKQSFEAIGPTGANAYNQIASSVLTTNLQLKESNKFLDSMATTMSNTLKWGVASRAMNELTGAVQKAWSFTKQLDTSLNDIMIVTDKSKSDMAAFAQSANSAAKALGTSTTDYTNASLIYYQQGLSDEEVAERTEVTLKAANVTGQAAKEVSEQLTAVWNGYQVTAEQAESSIDVLAAVAANTASNLEELSTGMSKVASSANAMGVSEEQLAAQLSTIISATRQAPETAGQALKTVYARMSTINAGGTDEDDGATLTSYTTKMNKFGISVLDANGKLRDMGEVIEEIGGKWDTFTREQQISLAQAMGGTRQYNNLLALFENWDEYTKTLNIAENATGTLQEQQDTYMESTAAHLQQLQTQWESIYNTLADTNVINPLIDALTKALGLLNSFISSLGGGMKTLTSFGIMGVNVFSRQIASGMMNVINNQNTARKNQEALQTVEKTAQLGMSGRGDDVDTQQAYDGEVEITKELLRLQKSLTTEEYNRYQSMNKELTALRIMEAREEAVIEKMLDEGLTPDDYKDIADQAEKEYQTAQRALANFQKNNREVLSSTVGGIDLSDITIKKENLPELSEELQEQITDGMSAYELVIKVRAGEIEMDEESTRAIIIDSLQAEIDQSKNKTVELKEQTSDIGQAIKQNTKETEEYNKQLEQGKEQTAELKENGEELISTFEKIQKLAEVPVHQQGKENTTALDLRNQQIQNKTYKTPSATKDIATSSLNEDIAKDNKALNETEEKIADLEKEYQQTQEVASGLVAEQQKSEDTLKAITEIGEDLFSQTQAEKDLQDLQVKIGEETLSFEEVRAQVNNGNLETEKAISALREAAAEADSSSNATTISSDMEIALQQVEKWGTLLEKVKGSETDIFDIIKDSGLAYAVQVETEEGKVKALELEEKIAAGALDQDQAKSLIVKSIEETYNRWATNLNIVSQSSEKNNKNLEDQTSYTELLVKNMNQLWESTQADNLLTKEQVEELQKIENFEQIRQEVLKGTLSTTEALAIVVGALEEKVKNTNSEYTDTQQHLEDIALNLKTANIEQERLNAQIDEENSQLKGLIDSRAAIFRMTQEEKKLQEISVLADGKEMTALEYVNQLKEAGLDADQIKNKLIDAQTQKQQQVNEELSKSQNDLKENQETQADLNNELDEENQKLREQQNQLAQIQRLKKLLTESTDIDKTLQDRIIEVEGQQYKYSELKLALQKKEVNQGEALKKINEALTEELEKQQKIRDNAKGNYEAAQNVKNGTDTAGKASSLEHAIHTGSKGQGDEPDLPGIDAAAQKKAIADTTKALSGLAMGFKSVARIASIFRDESLSGFEKFTQIISNLLISLPMLQSSLKSITSLTNSLTVIFDSITQAAKKTNELQQNAKEIKETAAKQEDTQATNENSAATTQNTEAKQQNAEAAEAEAAAQQAATDTKREDTIVEQENAAAEQEKAAAREEAAIAQEGENANIDQHIQEEELDAAVTELSTKTEEKNTEEKVANGVAEGAKTAEIKKGAVAEGEEAVATGANTKETNKNTKAQIENTAAQSASNKATNKAGLGLKNLKESAGAAVKSIGTLITSNVGLVAGLGTVVGVAAGAAVAAYVIYENYTKEARAAEDAANATKQLTEANSELHSTYDELESAFDTYNTAKEGLDECIQGTEEWTEALKDTTAAAADLIREIATLKNIDLAQLEAEYGEPLYDRETGVLSQPILDAINDQLEAEVALSDFVVDYSTAYASQTQAESDFLDEIREATKGFHARNIQTEIEDHIEDLIGLTADEFQTAIGYIDPLISSYVKDWDQLQKAVESYYTSVNNSEILYDAARDLYVQDSLSTSDTSGIIAAQSQYLQSQIDGLAEEEEEILKKNSSKASADKNDEYQRILDAAQAAGYNWVAVEGQGAVTGIDKKREYHFADAESGEEVRPLDTKAAAQLLAVQEAVEQSQGVIDQIPSMFYRMSDNVRKGIESFADNGNFEDLTKQELETFFQGFLEDTDIDLQQWLANNPDAGIIEQYLQSLFPDMNLTELFGEDYAQNFLDSLQNYYEALDHITDNTTKKVQESFNKIDISELSITSQKEISDLLQKVQNQFGDEYLDIFSDFISHIDSSQLENFVDTLDSIDWGTVNIGQFRSELEDAGIILDDVSDESLTAFVAAMNDMEKSIEDVVDAYKESYTTLKGIVDSLSSIGDTISVDNYKDLIKIMGEGMSTFFAETLEGEYQLIKGADELKLACSSFLSDLFYETQQSLKEDISTAETLNEYFHNYNPEDVVTNSFQSVTTTEKDYDEWEQQNQKLLELGKERTLLFSTSSTNYRQKNQAQIKEIDDEIAELWDGVQQDEDGDYYIPVKVTTWVGLDTREDAIQNTLDAIKSYQDLYEATEAEQTALNKLNESYQENGQLTQEEMNTLNGFVDSMVAMAAETENFTTDLIQLTNELTQAQYEYAESFDNLTDLYDEYTSGNGNITYEAYNARASQLYEQRREEGLDSDDIANYTKYLEGLYDQELKAKQATGELDDSLEVTYDATRNVAIQILRMNSGVEQLAEGFEDWSSVLNDSSASSEEVYKALTGMQTAVADLLDTTEEFVDYQFIIDHLEEIGEAAEGSESAIDSLIDSFDESLIASIEIDDEEIADSLTSAFEGAADYLNDLDLEMGVSIKVEDEDAIQALNKWIEAAQLTSEQVQAIFRKMGYNVDFKPAEVQMEQSYPVTTTQHLVEDQGVKEIYGSGGQLVKSLPIYTEYEIVSTQNMTAEEIAAGTGMEIETADGETYGGNISVDSAQIQSISKKASGSANNYSSINAGGGSPSGSSSSSSSSTSEPKHEDAIEGEIDRYHDINLRLQAISVTLSRLQKQEDKLFGQNLIDNLNDQLATLDDQIDATRIKIGIATDEANEYKADLMSQGVTFNADGYITNYASAMQSQLNYVNSIIDKYNAMSAEEQEAYQDTLDKAKDDYEDFVQKISDYDTLISETIPGLEDDIQDALDQEIQIQIQKFTMEVEIRLDMEQAERDWNEFYRKIILGIDDEDILGGAVQDLADALSYFNTTGSDILNNAASNDINTWLDQIDKAIAQGGTGSVQSLTDQVLGTLDQLKQIDDSGWSSVYGDNQTQALEDLQTYYTELMNEIEDIQDLVEDIEQAYLDMIDEAIDAFDEQVDQYEYLNDLLEHDINLIGLLYGDDAYEQMNRYYEQIEENNNQELDFLRQRVQYAYQMMQLETDDEARKKWEEEWENSLSALNDKVEDAVQNIIDKYTNTIDQIIDELNNKVTSGLGLNYVSEEWDLINQEADIYLDTINAAFAVEELRNKYLDAIDNTDSISAQQKLRDLMEEQVSYLEEKENLTQYDVDRANMLYDITLKEIALEEAQQNKSTMRLRRDSQGNYTYQYVADADEVKNAEEELAAARNDLYNFDKEAYIQNLDDLYSIYEEFVDKVLELYEDQTLSAEEREKMIALYVEYYGNIANDLITENTYLRTNLTESAIADLAMLYDTDLENFQNMTDEEIDDLMSNLVPQWISSVQEMADYFAGNGGFIPVCEDALNDLEQATEDYETELDIMASIAGVDLDELAEGYDYVTDQVRDLISENDQLINQYSEQISEIQGVVDKVHELVAAYQDAYTAAQQAITAAYSYYQAANQAAAAAASAVSNYTSSYASTGSSGSSSSSSSKSSSSSSSSSSGTSGNGVVEIGDRVLYKSGIYYNDSNGQNPNGNAELGNYVYITNYKTDGRSKPIHISRTPTLGEHDLGWLEKSQIEGYDTGGYTGDWDNDEGKVALLHQKEIVLNQEDTQNLLNAVNIVRDIGFMLNSFDTNIFNQINQLMNHIGNVASNMYQKESNDLNQNVHIDASFPNVTNSNEIEQAFNNLVNVASQYAYNNQR